MKTQNDLNLKLKNHNEQIEFKGELTRNRLRGAKRTLNSLNKLNLTKF